MTPTYFAITVVWIAFTLLALWAIAVGWAIGAEPEPSPLDQITDAYLNDIITLDEYEKGVAFTLEHDEQVHVERL